ncbi:unnamed protein product [Mytilus edulis]|uniref:B box-type domain-containing protein n=1 Tax=Mytilus edulis TaxID=6550 RepID=A0A8S3S4Q5_MYTED|nr:unnamed protein product [Mytilus edulis]
MTDAKPLCEPCSTRNIESIAIQYCQDCDEQFCEVCTASHKTQKATKGHAIVDIKLAQFNTPKRNASGYCLTCDDPEPLCPPCAEQHTAMKLTRDHKLSFDIANFILSYKSKEEPTADAVCSDDQRTCESCAYHQKSVNAAYYCKECDEFMCDACYLQHKAMKNFSMHDMVDVNSMSSSVEILKNKETEAETKTSSDEEDEDYNIETLSQASSSSYDRCKTRQIDMGMPACEPCSRENNTVNASYFCEECDENLCEECYNFHQVEPEKPTAYSCWVMACNWTVCGVCDSLEITKPSDVWCSECDEGLYTECGKHHAVSKASRSHSTIPIAEYKQLPTDILKIVHTCSKHNEKFQTYCKKHDCPCCHRCVIETHNGCIDITAIDDIIKDVKSSNTLYDIELMIEEVAENLEKITKFQKDNVISLNDQRTWIDNKIKQTRIKINCHLDQIQEELLEKLNTIEERERKKIENLLTSLEEKKTEMNEFKTTLSNVKQHASDLQVFLTIKQMENRVIVEGRLLETLANSDSLKQISLSLKDDDIFQKISNLKSIGQIEVAIGPNEAMITRMKGKQAQLELVSKSPRLIEDIQLNLKRTVKTGLENTKGCLILPDDSLVLSCRSNNVVRFFSSQEKKDFEITISPRNVIDVAFIPEENTIVTTSGGDDKHCINIIDIKDRTIIREVRVNSSYYGVVYNDSKLITCAKDEGLNILKNGNCEVVEEIKIKEMTIFSYITAFEDKLYYTNRQHHTVTCCDMKGTNLWTFKKTSILSYPQGVTVDNYGNVYVTTSCNVIVISSDGKRVLELLKKRWTTSPLCIKL